VRPSAPGYSAAARFAAAILIRISEIDGMLGATAVTSLPAFARPGVPTVWARCSSTPPPNLVLDGDPLEEVHFLRDEQANIAWAIENPGAAPARRQQTTGRTGRNRVTRGRDRHELDPLACEPGPELVPPEPETAVGPHGMGDDPAGKETPGDASGDAAVADPLAETRDLGFLAGSGRSSRPGWAVVAVAPAVVGSSTAVVARPPNPTLLVSAGAMTGESTKGELAAATT
jgi:hypothetical protein